MEESKEENIPLDTNDDEKIETTRSEEELNALQILNENAKQFRSQGNYKDALKCIENSLILSQHIYGSNSNEVKKGCRIAGELCNLLAMTSLQQDDLISVFQLLKKADILTEHNDPCGRAATYNNYACYYRRKGKLHAALEYLEKVLSV